MATTDTGDNRNMSLAEAAHNTDWQTVAAYVSSGFVTAVSALTLQEWGVIVGLLFGAATFEVNRRNQRRRTKAAEEAAEAAKRADEAKAQYFEGDNNAESPDPPH